jgi:AcrR family transcriptional regulator
MATALKVSRGSFYWHFRDLEDFLAEIRAAWQDRMTERIIRDLDEKPGPERLRHLMQRGFVGQRRLDRAIRSWAAEDEAVAALVAQVDTRRVSHIAALLVAAGIGDRQAQARATFLYWAYLGQTFVAAPAHATISADALEEIAALFQA